jgi:DnaK suppressor protein
MRTYAAVLNQRIAQAQIQRSELARAIEEIRVARSLSLADDEHDPDGSTPSLDQARDVALYQRLEQTLTELTQAQQRLASGPYGLCEGCGQKIPDERLLARPGARSCVACAAAPAARRRSGEG